MQAFIPKKIKLIDDFGEVLRQARNLKNISLDEAASATSIRKEYLLALEMNDFAKLPAGIYSKNYLKTYAKLLGISKEEVERLSEELSSEIEEDEPFSTKVLKRRQFISFPKIVRNFLISLAVLACFLYLLLYSINIVSSPKLEVSEPADNLKISEQTLLVSGKTELGSELLINNELVLLDKDGSFSQEINLKKGLNTLKISSKKKYSRENIIIKQILVE